jgi:hypothetical protein
MRTKANANANRRIRAAGEVRAVRAAPAPLYGLALAIGMTAVLVSGCSLSFADRICNDGEYPVMGAANPAGGMCVPNGEEPPGGYVRYPAGKVPQHVDDKWDLYWSHVTTDVYGNVVSG